MCMSQKSCLLYSPHSVSRGSTGKSPSSKSTFHDLMKRVKSASEKLARRGKVERKASMPSSFPHNPHIPLLNMPLGRVMLIEGLSPYLLVTTMDPFPPFNEISLSVCTTVTGENTPPSPTVGVLDCMKVPLDKNNTCVEPILTARVSI